MLKDLIHSAHDVHQVHRENGMSWGVTPRKTWGYRVEIPG